VRKSGNAIGKRYKALLAEAGKKFAAGDVRIGQYAALVLQREAILVRLIGGEPVDSGDLLKLDAALKELLPPSELPRIQVRFVEGCSGIYWCEACGAKNVLGPGKYTPENISRHEPATTPPAARLDAPATSLEAPNTKSKPEPPRLVIQKDTRPPRPGAPVNGGGSLCWTGSSAGRAR
jgi:hypothetical protein